MDASPPPPRYAKSPILRSLLAGMASAAAVLYLSGWDSTRRGVQARPTPEQPNSGSKGEPVPLVPTVNNFRADEAGAFRTRAEPGARDPREAGGGDPGSGGGGGVQRAHKAR